MFNLVAFSIPIILYNHHSYLIPEDFHHPKMKTTPIKQSVPILPQTLNLGQPLVLLSVSIDIPNSVYLV